MDSEQLLAKRYAQAFLNVFTLTRHDLSYLTESIELLKRQATLLSLLKIPLIDTHVKVQMLEKALKGIELPALRSLIILLIAHKRAYLLPQILKSMITLFRERQGIEVFTVVSPLPLNDQNMGIIQKFLAHETHHVIECVQKKDKTLIAGIRLYSSLHQWEYSIRKQLLSLQKYLSE